MMGECFTKSEGLLLQGDRRDPSWVGRGADQNYWRVRLKYLVKLIMLIIVIITDRICQEQYRQHNLQISLDICNLFMAGNRPRLTINAKNNFVQQSISFFNRIDDTLLIDKHFQAFFLSVWNIFQIVSQLKLSNMTYFRNRQPNPANKKPTKQPQPIKKWHRNNAPPSSIRHNPENDKDWSETMRNFLHDLLHEQNKSMEDMLNSSINHFTRYLEDGEQEDIHNQNHQLKQQNLCLKTAIEELRSVLKLKLEEALRKQREDLNVMMQDYIQLIKKLLHDKEDYAAKIEQATGKAGKAEAQKEELLILLRDFQEKNQEMLQQKDRKIQELEKEIEAQSIIIAGSQSKVQQSHRENDELKAKITTLSQKTRFSYESQEREHNTQKTKLLLDLLLQSQQQIKKLKERLKDSSANCQKDELISQLNSHIKTLQAQHEQQFQQYQQSMQQMLKRKDEYIQKLNTMIFSYRKQLNSSPSSAII